jgi:hypothetical protein
MSILQPIRVSALDVYNVAGVWSQVRQAGDDARMLANASASDIVASVLLTNDTSLLQRYFDEALAEHKAARPDGSHPSPATKKAVSTDWSLFSKRLWFHLDKANLRVSFPTIAGAGGTVTLTAKSEALAKAQAEAAEKAANDRKEREAHEARMAANLAAALEALTPEQIADTLAESLDASGHSLETVLRALTERHPRYAPKFAPTETA